MRWKSGINARPSQGVCNRDGFVEPLLCRIDGVSVETFFGVEEIVQFFCATLGKPMFVVSEYPPMCREHLAIDTPGFKVERV